MEQYKKILIRYVFISSWGNTNNFIDITKKKEGRGMEGCVARKVPTPPLFCFWGNTNNFL